MAATRRLDHHIDRVTALVRADRSATQSVQVTGSVSLPTSVSGSPTASQAQQHLARQDTASPAPMFPPESDQPRMEKVTVRTCHGCHAPIDTHHKGYSAGANLCPLEHWDGCPGGIKGGRDTSGKEWRACDFAGNTGDDGASTDGEVATDEEENAFHDTLGDDHLLDRASGGSGAASVDVRTPDQQQHISPGPEKDRQSHYDVTMVDMGSDLDEERVLRDLEAANNLLQSQYAKREQDIAAQLKQERARKIKMLKAENARLSAGMGGDTGGGKPKHLQQASSDQSKASRVKASTRNTGWQPAFQEHLTRNQSRASQYRPEEAPLYTGIDINGIRKIPVIGTQVDNLVGQIQSKAPSLDRRPTASLGQQLPVPLLRKKVTIQSDSVVDDAAIIEEDFVFSRRPDGSLVKVRVVNETISRPAKSLASASARSASRWSKGRDAHIPTSPVSDPDTSSDEDCDETPRPGCYFRWKRDNAGVKYNVEEEIRNQSPEMIYKYVRDPATGRSYKQLVTQCSASPEQTYKQVIDPASGQLVMMSVPAANPKVVKRPSMPFIAPTRSGGQYVDRRSVASTPGVHISGGSRTPQSAAIQHNERMPAFIVPTEDKQGKSSIPDIVQYARSCPVAWTSKVTSDKLNMGLWCWSYVAELLASRTGQTPSLSPGELEARLQHFLNVLEIALQPSNPAEFDGHSWRVARLYAEKVQHKIDRGETWMNFELRYGADSQPHELMAAKEEVKPVRKPKEPWKEDPKGKPPKDDFKGTKRSCTTWNTSSVEGKCDFEVQHDGRSCDRRHECSWCKEKGKKSLHHQRSFCRQRIAANEQ